MYRTVLRTLTAMIMAVGLSAAAIATAGAQGTGELPVPGVDGVIALILNLLGAILGGLPL